MRRGPATVGNNTRFPSSAARVVPVHDTGSLVREHCRVQLALFLDQCLVVVESEPERGSDSVNEPRSRITAARPFDAASTVEDR